MLKILLQDKLRIIKLNFDFLDFLKFLLQDKLSFIKDSFIESLLLFNIEFND